MVKPWQKVMAHLLYHLCHLALLITWQSNTFCFDCSLACKQLNKFGEWVGNGARPCQLVKTKVFKRAVMLLLEKCNYKKRSMPPFIWVIYPLAWPKVAKQQKKKEKKKFGEQGTWWNYFATKDENPWFGSISIMRKLNCFYVLKEKLFKLKKHRSELFVFFFSMGRLTHRKFRP